MNEEALASSSGRSSTWDEIGPQLTFSSSASFIIKGFSIPPIPDGMLGARSWVSWSCCCCCCCYLHAVIPRKVVAFLRVPYKSRLSLLMCRFSEVSSSIDTVVKVGRLTELPLLLSSISSDQNLGFRVYIRRSRPELIVAAKLQH